MRFFYLLLLLHSPAVLANCWERAGQSFGIEPALLYAIAQQESGLNPLAGNHNRNGSNDIGLMQINSTHLPRLNTMGIKEQHLLQDSCLSVMIGASILSDMMKRYGYSWEAVGAYNAGTGAHNHALRMHYAHQVWQRYQRLQPASNVNIRQFKSHPRID
ncbi:type III secretion system invasion protein IagB [Iodobacter ciconiae]|uniref:Type III secretion system invasion protein IagB n=1 Tax=Iodobacter ciconiae TaxID=2496266 RepID=A0A3S8ZR75_9NEIS|nr:type III secretion system invasion protein IagB [Iodobacter ciconiae]AZN35915.1 type III secretion system invasion protein IagB [Iodobacter ciconiae]